MSAIPFGDLVLELRAMNENMVAMGPSTSSLPELLAAAADEIDRLRLEREEMVAGFSAATRGMDHKAVFDLITAAKKYAHDRRNQTAT